MHWTSPHAHLFKCSITACGTSYLSHIHSWCSSANHILLLLIPVLAISTILLINMACVTFVCAKLNIYRCSNLFSHFTKIMYVWRECSWFCYAYINVSKHYECLVSLRVHLTHTLWTIAHVLPFILSMLLRDSFVEYAHNALCGTCQKPFYFR